MSLFTRIIKFHKKLSIPLDKLSQGMNKRFMKLSYNKKNLKVNFLEAPI